MRPGRAFGAVGAAIGSRPLLFFLISIVVFIGSLLSLYIKMPLLVLSFEEGYTTQDAPSIKELKAQVGFFGNRGKPWYMALFAQPRDPKGSMTEGRQFEEFKEFYEKIKSQLVISESPNRTITYMDFCEPMCDFNGVLFMTYNLLWFGNFHWPVTSLFGYNSNIGKHFFEREMKLVSSKLSGLYFMVFINSTEMAEQMEEFERLVQREVQLHNSLDEKATILTQHGARQVETEINRGTTVVLRKVIFGIGLTVVVMVIVLVLMNKAHNRSTPWVITLSMATLMVPITGLITAVAVYSLFGGHLNTLCSLAPVLSFAVGIDGMLHLYNSWLYESNMRKDSYSEILREVFASVYPTVSFVCAPAIGFLFGGLFPIPEIANLSIFFGITILSTYFYQTVLFTPAMLWSSPIFHHSPLPSSKPNDNCKTEDSCGYDCWNIQVTEPLGRLFTQSKLVVLGGFFLWTAFIAMPIIFGAEKLHGNLDYRHLLTPDSPSNQGIHFMSDRVWPDFLHIVYIIENPPHLENPEEYSRFMEFVADTEKVPGAMDASANMMWINDFKRYCKTPADAVSLNMTCFEAFINDNIYKAWRSGVQYTLREGETPTIDKMVYMVAVQGTRTMADKARVMQNFRRISARYPEFDAVPFDTEVGMVDVILQIPFALLVIPLIIYLVLFVFVFLFTFNVAISVVAVSTTISVYTGTLFTSALLGVTLNPFSVGYLLLISGIASRFVIHTAYYFKQVVRLIGKGGDARVARMQETLKKALLPTLLSSFAGGAILLPVLLAPVLIFQRVAVINLVQIFFGLLHCLLFTPLLLSILPKQLIGTSCFITSE